MPAIVPIGNYGLQKIGFGSVNAWLSRVAIKAPDTIYPGMRHPFDPCIPTKATKVPDRPEWFHEIKHDGYRLIIQRDGKRVRLFTRNGHDWTNRYPPDIRGRAAQPQHVVRARW